MFFRSLTLAMGPTLIGVVTASEAFNPWLSVTSCAARSPNNRQHAWRGQQQYPIHKLHHRRGPSTLHHVIVAVPSFRSSLPHTVSDVGSIPPFQTLSSHSVTPHKSTDQLSDNNPNQNSGPIQTLPTGSHARSKESRGSRRYGWH